MARAPEPEKPADHERWLVSFADFMTLLFALFVVLFANSQSDEMQMRELSQSIQQAFASPGVFVTGSGHSPISLMDGGTNAIAIVEVPSPPSMPGLGDEEGQGQVAAEEEPGWEEGWTPEGMGEDEGEGPGAGQGYSEFEDFGEKGDEAGSDQKSALEMASEGGEKLVEVYEELQDLLQSELLKGQIEMRKEKRGIVISLGEAGFFASGSDRIRTDSLPTVDEIAQKLKQIRNVQIRFEGHTDNVPLGRASSRFRDNWDLSLARAGAVLRRFRDQYSFDPRDLIVSGYGEFRPIDTNETPEGRARNRRVDIVILNEKSGDLEAGSQNR